MINSLTQNLRDSRLQHRSRNRCKLLLDHHSQRSALDLRGCLLEREFGSRYLLTIVVMTMLHCQWLLSGLQWNISLTISTDIFSTKLPGALTCTIIEKTGLELKLTSVEVARVFAIHIIIGCIP